MFEGLEDRYDYEAKGTVRGHWVPFAAEKVSPRLLPKLSVWFLPGPKVLELPAYRAVGIEPQQLLGFEWLPERARKIKKRVPGLPVVGTSLRAFLEDPAHAKEAPDWAHLDFDGSALSFEFEVREVVRRLRLDRASRLGVSSLGMRDRRALVESIKTLSLWAALTPDFFDSGLDLLRRGNERAGLVLEEPAMTYMLCRELAVSLLIMRAWGERCYGEDDARAAHHFRTSFEEVMRRTDQAVRGRVFEVLGKPAPIPMTVIDGLRELVWSRRVPVGLGDRLRFAYHSSHEKWRWTWYYRFASSQKLVSLGEWAETFFLRYPPLHVVDFTGVVISDRRNGVCMHCSKEREHG